jgi:hypothetical protein
MATTIRLTEDFENPVHRAGLEIILLLAKALGEVLSKPGASDTFDRSEKGSWLEVILLLGQLETDRETAVYETAEIGKLWEKLLGLNSLAEYELELIELLKEARDKSIEYAKKADAGLTYLKEANEEGHKIAKSILAKHGIGGLLATNPVLLEVFYDGRGEEYCAGSSAMSKMIRWAYQPLPHALAGALIAEHIFAHEYLSHLAPRNNHLDLTIREQWLVAALRGALEEDTARPYWKNRLWEPHREAMEGHAVSVRRLVDARASANDFSGYQGAERVLMALFNKDKALFWSLTVEILHQKSNDKLAEQALRVARGLTSRGTKGLKLRKGMTLKELGELMGL